MSPVVCLATTPDCYHFRLLTVHSTQHSIEHYHHEFHYRVLHMEYLWHRYVAIPMGIIFICWLVTWSIRRRSFSINLVWHENVCWVVLVSIGVCEKYLVDAHITINCLAQKHSTIILLGNFCLKTIDQRFCKE